MMKEKYGAGSNKKRYPHQNQYRNGSEEGQGQGKQIRKRNGTSGNDG